MPDTRSPDGSLTGPRLSPIQTDRASGLSYRLLQTPALDGNGDAPPPQALLLLLHGVGGNEMQLAALAQQQDARVRVVLVRGPLVFGPGQFGWFQVRFGPRGPSIDPAQAETSRQQLLRLVGSMQDATGVTPRQTAVAGFSQGGIMSAGLALTQPRQVGGFGLLSGRILPEIEPLIAPTGELEAIEGFISHGEHDDKLPLEWAHKADAWLRQLGVPHHTLHYPAGHELTPGMAADFRDWLNARLFG